MVILFGSCVALGLIADDQPYVAENSDYAEETSASNAEEPEFAPADGVVSQEPAAVHQTSVAELVQQHDPRACADPQTEQKLGEMIADSVDRRGQSAEAVLGNLVYEASLFSAKRIDRDTGEIVCSAAVTLQVEGHSARQFNLIYSLSPSLEAAHQIVIEVEGITLLGPRTYLENAIDLVATTEILRGNANAIGDVIPTGE